MTANPDCIFCKIVNGDLPSFKVAEDDHTLTFLDLFPVSEGHTLVIPKRHSRDILEIDAISLAAVSAASRRVAHAIEAALQPDGLSVFQLNRAAAGQTVFHYHMHLLPRTAGDPLKLHSRIRGDDDSLREIAARIAAALEREN
jgi:histidine triad (HIT) family protein